MIKINIHEAKTHLSRYLKQVAKGDKVVICKRNLPIAELRSIPPERQTPRPIGLFKGELRISEDFFLPLPDSIVDSFYDGMQ